MIRTRIASLLAALAMMLGVAVVSAGPAAAVPGGTIANSSSSSSGFMVYRDWGSSGPAASSPRRWLYPGQQTTWSDTDGFRVPTGKRATVYWPLRPSLSRTFSSGQYVKLSNMYGVYIVRIR